MRAWSKMAMVGLGAAFALAVAIGIASANRFSFSNTSIRTAITELTFSGGGSNDVRCAVTLEGTFHSSTFTKTLRALIGYITRATTNHARCTGIGKVTFNQASLPWHVVYNGFTGRLPTITSVLIRLKAIRFLIDEIPIIRACEYTGDADAAFRTEGAAGTFFVAVPETTAIPRNEAGSFCPTPYEWVGAAPATLLGTSTYIIVRLI